MLCLSNWSVTWPLCGLYFVHIRYRWQLSGSGCGYQFYSWEDLARDLVCLVFSEGEFRQPGPGEGGGRQGRNFKLQDLHILVVLISINETPECWAYLNVLEGGRCALWPGGSVGTIAAPILNKFTLCFPFIFD